MVYCDAQTHYFVIAFRKCLQMAWWYLHTYVYLYFTNFDKAVWHWEIILFLFISITWVKIFHLGHKFWQRWTLARS
jgi:hypothetical protein